MMKLSAMLVILFSSLLLRAQPFYETQIVPFDGKEYDYFADAIAISDSFIFAGSAHYNTNTGSVYIYKLQNDNYKFTEKIYASDGQEYDLFGARLYFKDNTLFVGAINKRVNTLRAGPGALYVFENKNNHWIEKQIIMPPTLYSYGGRFSCSISKYKNYLLIGAEQHNSEVELSGEAFLYKMVNGNYELYQEFTPPTPLRYQGYGGSVLLQENLLLISAVSDSSESGIYSGSVYAYRNDNSFWYYSQRYLPEANSEYLSLGTSIASNNDYIFVGSTANVNYYKPGKVYIYRNRDPTELELVQILETGYNNPFDRFGSFLDVKGDTLLVGAPDDTVGS